MKQRYLMLVLTAAGLYAATPVQALTGAQAGYALQRISGDNCRSNLGKIYAALTLYAKQHKGALPPGNNMEGLGQLSGYGLDCKALYCSSYKGKPAKSWGDLSPKNCSYLYFGGFQLTQTSQKVPYLPLVCDKFDNHHLMVLFANGEVITIEKRSRKNKITDCRSLVEALNLTYHYPPKVLEALRLKAAAIDKGH